MIRNFFVRIPFFIYHLGWRNSIAIVIAVAALGIGIRYILTLSTPADSAQQLIHQVELRSVSDLSNDNAPLQIVGTVNSKSEATVRAEASGQVIAVLHSLGDSVRAGTIVAELEDASQRAAVTQAQGAVDAAQANLDKVQKGTRSEQLAILRSTLDAARSGAVNSLLSAYSTVDNSIRGTTDTFFSNPESQNPIFNIATSNSNLTNQVQNMRLPLTGVLQREAARAGSLSPTDDLAAELMTTEGELRTVRAYLDTIISALNTGIATVSVSQATITADIAAASAARTTLNTALSSISSARQALTSAENSFDQGVTGAQPEDVAASQAALKQAQGALASARANLEKSIIRAPISGTINSFSLKVGDYVSQTTPVLTVANNGALEIVAYVTDQDAHDIAVGTAVGIESDASGVITRVAPALDPITKKIEVRIGVSSGIESLTNGQSVTLTLTRVNRVVSAKTPSRITIPISAIKVGADATIVFTVTPDMTLVSHPVVLGALLGDRVEITQGLTGDMQIVTDARGLREGETVTLK